MSDQADPRPGMVAPAANVVPLSRSPPTDMLLPQHTMSVSPDLRVGPEFIRPELTMDPIMAS
jgi:hypothetical protein